MANRVVDLVTRLIARDDASKVIERVADDLDKLEKRKDVEVGVGIDDKATDQVRELDRRLDGLSDEDKTIVLRAQAKDAQREVDRLVRSLKDVDKLDDEEVRIRVTALGDAKAELKAIEDQAERLDREDVDVKVDVDKTGFDSGWRSLQSDLRAAPGMMGKVGVLGTAAFGSIGAAAATAGATAAAAVAFAVGRMTTDFQNLALEVGKASDALGFSTEDASRLKEVSEDLAIPFATLETAIGRMNKVAESTPSLFSDIGAAIVRDEDDVLDVTDTFLNVATALDNIPDAGQRAVAGAKIFGKGWAQIAELVEQGGLSIAAAMEQVADSKIITGEQVDDARAMRDAIDGMKDRWEEFSNSIGSDLVPAVTTLIGVMDKLAGVTETTFDVLSGDFDVPVLDKAVRYLNPITGAFNLAADAASKANEEWNDFRGNIEKTVDLDPNTVAGLGGLNEILEDLANKTNPLGALPEQWKILMDDIADGTADTQAASDAAELLAGYLGIGADEVVAIAQAELDKTFEDAEAAAQGLYDAIVAGATAVIAANEKATAEAEAFRDAVVEAALAGADTKMQMEDLAGVFDQLGKRGDALRSIFDLQNAPLDAESAVRDVEIAIDDLSEAAKDVDLSEGLDPSNVNADALLDAIDSLRPEIQARVVEAFQVGGPEAATKLAQDYIAQVAAELKISEIQAAELLGMTDVQAIVNVAIEQTSLANAQAQLDILTGLGGQTPLTASIALGLQAGTLTPDQAQLLIQEQLGDLGVEIPGELLVEPKPGEMRKARQALQTEADDNPTKQPVEPKGLVEAAAIITAGPAGGWPPIEVPVVPVFPSGLSTGSPTPYATPLALPTATGLATTGPTATTSSAVPMTLALPAAPAPSRTIVINQVIQAAVIGSPFDVARAVEAANRRLTRLMPSHP